MGVIFCAILLAGVPKYRRGEVWKFLVRQHGIRSPNKNEDASMTKQYKDLLEQPTSHQHAILIDLGKNCICFCIHTGTFACRKLTVDEVCKFYTKKISRD